MSLASISSGISSFTIPGSGAIPSADTGSSNVKESLRLNSGYLGNGDSGNALMISGVSSSGDGRSVMVEDDSGDSRNDESVTLSVCASSSGDG